MRGGEGPHGVYACLRDIEIGEVVVQVVRCKGDFMVTYWVSTTCFARLTYWSVTQLMCLNSKMTRSPPFASASFLIANPSGRLFHSLSITIVSSVVPVSYFLFSVSVKG
jgi:hypothetical protein